MTLRFPVRWLDILDALAKKGSEPGLELTRTDIARHALAVGLDVLQKRPKEGR
jgi:hypothetical protein